MIIINDVDYRHVAKAVANYRHGRERIEDEILIIADHIRAGRRHVVDSLSAGESAKWKAEDALFEELVAQVLVAVEISCTEHKHDVKWKMHEAAACEAGKKALEKFEAEKTNISRQATQEWLDFHHWKRMQECKSLSTKHKKGANK